MTRNVNPGKADNDSYKMSPQTHITAGELERLIVGDYLVIVTGVNYSGEDQMNIMP